MVGDGDCFSHSISQPKCDPRCLVIITIVAIMIRLITIVAYNEAYHNCGNLNVIYHNYGSSCGGFAVPHLMAVRRDRGLLAHLTSQASASAPWG